MFDVHKMYIKGPNIESRFMTFMTAFYDIIS